MGAFSNSWQITKASFEVVRQDKEILLFPLLAGIFSLLLLVTLAFPYVISYAMGRQLASFGFLQYLLMFIMYFGLSFIATFFSVCVVYTTKKRFESKNAAFGESINFAFSRIHLIFLWSLVSATVGLILRLIERLSKRFGILGEMITKITTSILGLLWGVATIFVVPAMVYKNLSPFDAVKSSVSALKKTWGEGIIGFAGMGFAQFSFILIGIVLAVFLFFVSPIAGAFGVIGAIFVVVAYFLGVILFFSVLESVFTTALYVYAQTGKIPQGYSDEIMNNAFRKKNKI